MIVFWGVGEDTERWDETNQVWIIRTQSVIDGRREFRMCNRDMAFRMHNGGASLSEIAKKLNVSQSTARGWVGDWQKIMQK